MLTQPRDISDSQIIDLLRSAWGLDATSAEYLAVGFGSHHWRCGNGSDSWFVTVDDLRARRHSQTESSAASGERLLAALHTARHLVAAGLTFVVAPISTSQGRAAAKLDPHYLMAVHPHVSGETFEYGEYQSSRERDSVVELLAQLHTLEIRNCPLAAVDDLQISNRDGLERALDQVDVPWSSGVFAEPSRRLLRRHIGPLGALLDLYDQLVEQVLGESERFVVTHGEPHRGNTIRTDDGLVLVDWDTVLVGPPERDMWRLVVEDPSTAALYAARTGTRLSSEAIEVYRLSWDLNEIAIYLHQFYESHIESDDTAEAHRNLHIYLDPSRWSLPG